LNRNQSGENQVIRKLDLSTVLSVVMSRHTLSRVVMCCP